MPGAGAGELEKAVSSASSCIFHPRVFFSVGTPEFIFFSPYTVYFSPFSFACYCLPCFSSPVSPSPFSLSVFLLPISRSRIFTSLPFLPAPPLNGTTSARGFIYRFRLSSYKSRTCLCSLTLLGLVLLHISFSSTKLLFPQTWHHAGFLF